jgi:hypothetical protein
MSSDGDDEEVLSGGVDTSILDRIRVGCKFPILYCNSLCTLIFFSFAPFSIILHRTLTSNLASQTTFSLGFTTRVCIILMRLSEPFPDAQMLPNTDC